MAELTKPMIITKEAGVTSLDPRAVAKFATAMEPGRVLNVSCETDSTGTASIQLVHPDGSTQTLCDVTMPVLAKGETCKIGARLTACVIGAEKDAEAEVAMESK